MSWWSIEKGSGYGTHYVLGRINAITKQKVMELWQIQWEHNHKGMFYYDIQKVRVKHLEGN